MGDDDQQSRPRESAATVGDIAAAAKVSQSTVSLVLNGRWQKYRISEATAERVRETAERLAYVPNEVARWLRRGQTGDVGVVLPHLRNNWADQVMLGIESVLDGVGLVPMIVHHREIPERNLRGLEALVQRRVCGVICSPMAGASDAYRRVIARGIPLVFIGDVPNAMPEASVAAWDPAEIAQPIDHLVSIGRRRVMFLGYDDPRPISLDRYSMVRRALSARGMPVDDRHWIMCKRSETFDAAIAQAFADRGERPDAVFTLYDDVAMRAIDALRRHGLDVPGDVAVAATGTGLDSGSRAYRLTLMRAPVSAEGAEAARLLLEHIESPATEGVRRHVRGGSMVIGQTTQAVGAPPRVAARSEPRGALGRGMDE